METNCRLGRSVKRHETIGTAHYERGSPVGICNARVSLRGSDVSRRSTVHRIPITEQGVYTGRRKDCRNAALRSLFRYGRGALAAVRVVWMETVVA
jgi:hypothetical protein